MRINKLYILLYVFLIVLPIIEGYSITTFSDGTATGNLTFTSAGSLYKNLHIPNWATVSSAKIDLKGFELNSSVDSEPPKIVDNDGAYISNLAYGNDSDWGSYANHTCGGAPCNSLNIYLNYTYNPDINVTTASNLSITIKTNSTSGNTLIYMHNYTSNSFKQIGGYATASYQAVNVTFSNLDINSYTNNSKPVQVRVIIGSGLNSDTMFFESQLRYQEVNYPTNLTIRTNNTIVYQNLSTFNGSVNDIDLNITLLQSCVDLCYFSIGSNCLCEVNFTSSSNGGLNYSNLNISLDIEIGNCTTYPELIINLTQQDENTLTDITPTNLEVEVTFANIYTGETAIYNSYTNETSLAVCTTETMAEYLQNNYTIDVIAGYEATDYVKEFWYLDNGSIGDYFNEYTPNHVYLYDLPSTDSTTFLFRYTDEYGLEVDNAIIHTYRKYIGDGIYREVERSRQDDNGETHVHLIEEDVAYYFMVTQEGVIKFISNTYNAKCLSSPCTLELKGTGGFTDFPPYSTINGSTFSASTNKTSRTSTLSYASNASHTINYTIYRFDGIVSYVNSSTSTGSKGAISLTIPMEYGNMTYIGAIYQDGEFVKSEWIDLKPSGRELFGNTGAIMSGFIIMAFGLMTISEGPLLIVALIVMLIGLGLLSLVDLAWFTIMAITCTGGIIVWAIIKRKNG